MSSFYDDASLVVIPSGYKTSKVYAEKPTDGSGDLAFTRTGDTATRVNSAGIIEKVRTNIYLNSEQFNNASWTKSNSTVAANTATAPNGTTTADTLSDIVGTSLDYLLNVTSPISYTSGTPYTVSFYAKNVDRRYMYIRFVTNAFGSNKYAYFDLQDGVISKLDAGTTATITAVGDGWYRCTASATATTTVSTIFAVYIGLSNDGLNNFYTNAAPKSVYIWGAQLETSDIATPYIPTLTAAVSTGPVANVPRLDYLGSTCGKLLLEPQRTNTLTYSEAFDNAAWTKLNATISANTTDTLDPSGYNGADKITDDTTNGAHIVYRFSTWDTTQRTASVYAKAGTSSKITIQNASTGQGAFFDLSTGTISALSAPFTATITAVGNGWYRITATHTAASSQTLAIGFFTGTATTNYAGTGSYAYLWGAQLEAGAYATSYIPTLAASATRGADACTKTGIGSLFGSSYTLFGEYVNQGVANTRLLTVKIPSGGNYDNFITIFQSGTGLTATGNDASSVAQFSIASGSYSVGQTLKFALRCDANNVAFYINGVQIGTDNTATIPAVTAIWVGNYIDVIGRSVVNQVLTFPTALSNSDLAALTA